MAGEEKPTSRRPEFKLGAGAGLGTSKNRHNATDGEKSGTRVSIMHRSAVLQLVYR